METGCEYYSTPTGVMLDMYKRVLGKVVPTPKGKWDTNMVYERLDMVYHEESRHAFIAKCCVPKGVDLENRDFWMPFNVSGYSDSNVIVLGRRDTDATLHPYTLKEAVESVADVGRKVGVILTFYNENTDRLDIGGRWEIWQFNSQNVYDWENLWCWQNLYYNYNKFVGAYKTPDLLIASFPFPEVGCYAYVGDTLKTSVVYRCDVKGIWQPTNEKFEDVARIVIGGHVTVGDNGNWWVDGTDTGFAAVGPEGNKTVLRVADNGDVQYNYVKSNEDDASHVLGDWTTIYNISLCIPFIQIGTVTSVPYSQNPSVSISGGAANPKLNFALKQGNPGAQGIKGDGASTIYAADVESLPSTGVNNGQIAIVGSGSSTLVYTYNGSTWVQTDIPFTYDNGIIDGGRADTVFTPSTNIDCGRADNV